MLDLLTIFTSQGAAGSVVDLIILGLFFVGLLDVWRGRALISSEWRQLLAARQILTGAERGSILPENAVNTLHISPGSLLGKRLTRLLQLRAAGLGYREVLERLTMESIEGYGGHARYIATSLTLLGLLGTVIGMSLAMLKMSDVFQSVNDPSKLDSLTTALSHTLDGMKTAFGCTLAGLLGALALSAVNHFFRRRQTAYLQDVEDWVSCELTPVLEEVDPKADEAARAFASVLQDATGTMTTFSGALTTAAEHYKKDLTEVDSFTGKFTEAMQKLAESAAAITATQSSFTQVVQSTQTSLVALNGTLGIMEKTLADLKGGVLAQNTAIQKLVTDSTGSMSGAFQKHLEETRKDLTKIMEENSVKLQSFSDMMLDLHLDGRGAGAARAARGAR